MTLINSFFMTNASIVDQIANHWVLLLHYQMMLFKSNEVVVCQSSDFQKHTNVRMGIQSGPMLIADGVINNHFNPNSRNRNIRSGVGM